MILSSKFFFFEKFCEVFVDRDVLSSALYLRYDERRKNKLLYFFF